MQVFFSTVVRATPVEKGGELIQLDWDRKTVLSRIPIAPKNPKIIDPNPRENSRGGRGIVMLNDEIFVASYHTLEGYNSRLEPTRNITNGLLVGLHEVCKDERGNFWVASTAIDAAIKIDSKTGEALDTRWPREDPVFSKVFNLTPLHIDKRADNRTRFLERSHLENPSHLHLNAVVCWKGNVYTLFNRFGAVVNLSESRVILRDDSIQGCHNLVITKDGIVIINSTRGRKIVFYTLRNGKKIREITLLNYKWVRNTLRRYSPNFFQKMLRKFKLFSSVAHPIFIRGLDLADNHIFVGISPATILCVNYQTGELVDLFPFSDDVRVYIHGLKVFPPYIKI